MNRLEEIPFSRQFTFDIGRLGREKHHIRAMLEVDVTEARARLKAARRESARPVSFSAWVLCCIARAVMKHPHVHALRKGSRHLMVFDEVDISFMVEKQTAAGPVPLPVVFRAVQLKSAGDITALIREASEVKLETEDGWQHSPGRKNAPARFFAALPQWLRLIIWRLIYRNPARVKAIMGTVLVTAVGMMGKVRGWFIPYSTHPLAFALGSVVQKPGIVKGEVVEREYLQMTVLIDHDVVDGAPAARFISELVGMIERGENL